MLKPIIRFFPRHLSKIIVGSTESQIMEAMEDQKTTNPRATNWSPTEKKTLLDLMEQQISVIEEKYTVGNAKKRNETWE